MRMMFNNNTHRLLQKRKACQDVDMPSFFGHAAAQHLHTKYSRHMKRMHSINIYVQRDTRKGLEQKFTDITVG